MSAAAGSPGFRPAVPIAVLANQSLVWGLICRETLNTLGIPACFLDATDIRKGALDRHRVLLVPGGWATHKLHALGAQGKKAVTRFIETGGGYLGFCGGAGLALSSSGLLNLVPVKRLSLEQRLPNISGPVWIAPQSSHPAWNDLPHSLPASIWWPSQFRLPIASGVSVLASYQAVAADFQVADLPLGDLRDMTGSIPWAAWESHYGINLNPERLAGQPAILEARYGKGCVVLSYPHLETPGELWANRLFRNLLRYLDRQAAGSGRQTAGSTDTTRDTDFPCTGSLYHLRSSRCTIDDLIEFGTRHLLWNRRNSWLLNWRRGLRGLEYGTLAVTSQFLCEHLEPLVDHAQATSRWLQPARELDICMTDFCRLAKRLLLEEKVSTQSAVLSKVGNVNAAVDDLRCRLFGTRMNHGGLSRDLLDRIDRLLLAAWKLPETAR